MVQRRKTAQQISEIANRLVDPILAKRAGISTTLLGAWHEIAGPRFAATSRPERIRWPKQADVSESGGFEPGQLTIACEGPSAVFMMHEEGELISRINGFFGFPAVDRVRFVQKPVSQMQARPVVRPLDAIEKRRLQGMIAEVDDPKLREALEKLGAGVIARRRKQG